MLDEIKKAIKEAMAHADNQKFIPNELITPALLLNITEQIEAMHERMDRQDISLANLEIQHDSLHSSPQRVRRSVTMTEQEHSGIMIAFMLDLETARQLAIPGGEPPEEMHITLAYLGKMDELRIGDDRLKEVMEQFASRMAPLHIPGTTGGIGFFNPSEHSDNLIPMIALVNAHGLQSLRRELAATLMDAGISVASDFGDYLPHITLAYVDPGQALPLNHLPPPVQFSFDTLWLCIGDQRIPYSLGKLSDQAYYYKIEAISADGHALDNATIAKGSFFEQTNTQGVEVVFDQPTASHQEESAGTLPAIHGKDVRGNTDFNISAESDNRPSQGSKQDRDDCALGEPPHAEATENPQDSKESLEALSESDRRGQGEQDPDALKKTFANIVTSEILQWRQHQSFSVHFENAMAQLYLEAQKHAYNKAMKPVGIPVASTNEGIFKKARQAVATGIKTAFSDALRWAKGQVEGITGTLQDAFDNFVDGLGDIDTDDLALQTQGWLENYATWKVPQVTNVTWGTGADEGTNQALTDILEIEADPDLDTTYTGNVRVKVVPSESSNDYCADFAGNTYTIEEWMSLAVRFPTHPNCIHGAEVILEGEA